MRAGCWVIGLISGEEVRGNFLQDSKLAAYSGVVGCGTETSTLHSEHQVNFLDPLPLFYKAD